MGLSFYGENHKASKLQQAFQWAAAALAPLSCEAPQRAYDQAGLAWEYIELQIKARRAASGGPKL